MCHRHISRANQAISDGTGLAAACVSPPAAARGVPMSASVVYLFVRTPPDGPSSAVALRRLKALQELRDELRRSGGAIVTASPHRADLQVEITNVFASDDE